MDKPQPIEIIRRISKKNRVRRAGIFGSFARNPESGYNDIDLLVELPEGSSLFDFIALKLELEDELDTAVDLVEYKAIKPALRKSILAEEVRIYG